MVYFNPRGYFCGQKGLTQKKEKKKKTPVEFLSKI
jgi:hypothetical protein